jgi:3-hydroxyisobutyrate dehydrogenase
MLLGQGYVMPESIAFLGIGNLGLPMATNLLKAGHSVVAFDPRSERVALLAQLGAQSARSGAEAVREAGIVVTMVPSGKELRQVFFEDGVLAAARAGTLFIDCSTVDPESARNIKQAAQAAGHQMVDAPVSGGSVRSEQGALTIMVGATKEAFARAQPVLAAMGSLVRHLGPEGAGLLAKICNNMIAGVTQVAVSEAFVLARQLGLDTQHFFEVVANSSGQCWAVTTNCPVPGPVPNSPANFDYRPGGAATMLQKDLALAQAAAIQAGVPIPMAAQALGLYTLFCNSGLGHLDVSAIIKLYALPHSLASQAPAH